MKYCKIFLLVLTIFPFTKCYALLISHVLTVDNQLSYSQAFTFDLISQGYNPHTDIINFVTFSYDIKEIVEDPFEDTPDMDEREFVTIFDHFMYYRAIIPDMDTGIVSERMHWTPQEECRFDYEVDGEYVCIFKPDQDGMFYSYWNTDSNNLWMNSISVTLDVTRTNLNEPSPLLFIGGIIPLLILRLRRYRLDNKT